MTRNEVMQLFIEKKRKGITNKQVAQYLGCSESLISQFFNYKVKISQDKQVKMKQYIDEAKEYRMMKVLIE